ncbi:MAG TPA: amidohydrolase [Chloroflexota bacterium]|jgi:5-methylthioadenosine/S-adenosylhomocysteine deaminase
MPPSDIAPAQDVDLLILGGVVVTMAAQHPVLDPGAVAVRGREIVAVGPRDAVLAASRAVRTIDARAGLVMPGLVNGHTHLPMTLFRGLADDLPLDRWLQQYIWPSEREFLSPEHVRWGTLLGAAEMLRGGVTTFCDMYFYEDDVAAAAHEAGLRGIVAQGFLDVPTPQGLDVEQNIAYMEQLVARWQGHSRIVPAIGPHALYTVSPPLLERLHALAVQHDVPLVIHLAETQTEGQQIAAQYGASPVRALAQHGLLDQRLIAAHCVWVDPAEQALLAQSGAGVVHCPRSNLKLADGVAPVPDLLAAGVRLGLGTDGAASNNQINLFAEIDAAALIHKAVRLDPLAVPAAAAVEMATLGGARALGLDEQIGSLQPGKRADLVILDLNEDNLIPLYNPLSQLAYAARSADVATVLVDGQVVLQDRTLLTMDEPAVRRQVRALARDIAARQRAHP